VTAGGEGVEDDGEGDLNGIAVFDGIESNMLDTHVGFRYVLDGAKTLVTLVKAGVKEAPRLSAEGWRFALGSVVLMWRRSRYCIVVLLGRTP
jgi:hypothetical protein